jgi:hypothetical protein
VLRKEVTVDSFGRQVSWRALLVCAVGVLVAVPSVGFFGFGVAPWIILAGAFCVLMMGSMVWMMVAMGKHTIRRH